MSRSVPGASGAIVISLDQFRKKSAPQKVTPPAEKPKIHSRPCVGLLVENYILDMVSLQRDHLDKNKMVFRDKIKLWEHFNKVGGTAFGAFHDRKLVSMILMSKASDLPDEVQNLTDPEKTQRHAIIGGVLVEPNFKGMGLSQDMIKACVSDANIKGVDHVYARVRTENEESLKTFEKAGFTVLRFVGTSPDAPTHAVHYLHLNLAAQKQQQKTAEHASLSNIRNFHVR